MFAHLVTSLKFYSIFSGQPMTFVAPTGLTLAFLSGLYRYCTLQGYAFLPVYTWVGLWTSFFMFILGIRGSSKYIRYCTRFTDEVFNGLLSLTFIYEACASLRRNFMLADPMNLSMPFVSLSIALGTFWSTAKVTAFETSMFFNSNVRKITKDFGLVAVIFTFSAINQLKSIKKFGVPTLIVPNTFELAGGREFLVPFMTVPENVRWLCAFPAILLTCLFFMDQNISSRIVNKEENGLKKGAAYNIDMVTLGAITGGEFDQLTFDSADSFEIITNNHFHSIVNIWTALDVRSYCAVDESCEGVNVSKVQ